MWYKRAAEQGDKRAMQRLKASTAAPIPQPGGPGSVLNRDGDVNGDSANGKKDMDKDCIIM